MDTFFKVLFQDPILLAAALVLVAAALILLWALNAMKKIQGSSLEAPADEHEEEEPAKPAPAESLGLFEARLREISNQLAIVAQRLTELEKTVKDRSAKDQTIPGLVAPAEMEKLVKRIETKLEALNAETAVKPAAGGESLGRLESKLEGIHKLLILLTDSGGSEQK